MTIKISKMARPMFIFFTNLDVSVKKFFLLSILISTAALTLCSGTPHIRKKAFESCVAEKVLLTNFGSALSSGTNISTTKDNNAP